MKRSLRNHERQHGGIVFDEFENFFDSDARHKKLDEKSIYRVNFAESM